VKVGSIGSRNGARSFPSRLYSLMAAGRPIVAALDDESDAAALLRAAGCGLVTRPGEAEAMAQAVLGLRERGEERQAMGEAGRKYLETFHTKAGIVNQYAALFLEEEGSSNKGQRNND